MPTDDHSPFSLRKRLFERFVNTFLQIHPLWDIVISYDEFHGKHFPSLLRFFLSKIFGAVDAIFSACHLGMAIRFWPRLGIDAAQWRDGGIGRDRDPSHFVHIDKEEYIFMDEVVACTPGLNDPILDLGCNCGRFLNFLREQGYVNLHGVDISRAAREYMDEVFAELAKIVHFQCATFQEYLSSQPDQSMETIFTHGATVELVHPSFPLVKHICRCARSNVVLFFYETGHSYPRFWEWEFNSHGFYLARAKRPAFPETEMSLLVFRRA